jgi:ribosome-associated protein
VRGTGGDKKAEDVIILDLRGLSSFTDYFVICSATSEPHLKALSSGIRDSLHKEYGLSPLASDGSPASQWIVIDYSDVLVHIFHTDKRGFYALENLWSDAPRVTL